MGFLLYNQNKWWYKAITIILVLAIIVMISIGIAPHAKAVVGVATVVVSAVLAAMAAFGIGTIVSGMTSSQIEDYIGGKLQDWATSVGSPLDTLINSSLIGKTASSVFAIGAAAANGISDFISWLTTEESLTDNDSVPVIQYTGNFNKIYASSRPGSVAQLVLTGTPVYYYTIGNNQTTEYVGAEQDLYICSYIYNRSYYYIAISNNNLSGVTYYAGNTASTVAEQVLTNNYNSVYDLNYAIITPASGTAVTTLVPLYTSLTEALQVFNNDFSLSYSLVLETGIIDIPQTVANEDNLYLDVGATNVADVAGLADYVLDQVADNQLVSDYEIAEAPPIPSVVDINVDSYSPGAISQIQQAIQASIESALVNSGTIEVELVNDSPLSVNTDHHAFGFDLPDITFNFASIWHYVSDAVSYSSSFISWFVSLFISVPILSIPLYCCFTLVVVLGAFRRFLL